MDGGVDGYPPRRAGIIGGGGAHGVAEGNFWRSRERVTSKSLLNNSQSNDGRTTAEQTTEVIMRYTNLEVLLVNAADDVRWRDTLLAYHRNLYKLM
jgi:hypothetical protein